VRLGLTFAIAYLSYRYLEQPIRRGQPLFNLRPIRLAPIAIAALVVASLLLTRSAPQPVIDFEQAAAQFNNRTVDAGGPPGTLDTAALEPPRPRISVFGDSTALLTGNGLTLGNDNRVADFAYGFTQLGCGIGRGGERRSGPRLEVIPDGCNNWAQTWKTYIDANKPNIAVVQVGPWEVVDRKLAGDDQWRAPGDPVYDDYLLKEMIAAVDVLSAQGAEVIWLTSPPIKPGVGDGEHVQFARGQGEDPARMARFDQLIAALPRERPGRVHVLDLAGWLKASGEDERLRPDGVHLGMNGENAEVAKRWLLQAIVDVFDQDWRLRVANDPTAGKPTEPTSTSPTVDCRPPYQVCRAVS
jgi:hypothetical protein